MIILYTLVALLACLLGSMTGMGGGVIMKPVMDMLGDFDAATIGVLSSITVLAMSTFSSVKQLFSPNQFPWKRVVMLGLGSVAGGYLGQVLFELLQNSVDSDRGIKLVQNIVLAVMIAIIFYYMLRKEKINGLKLTRSIWFVCTGIALGLFSSFLGIGGGPINVAALSFLFGFDVKNAVMGSLVTIFFAQISKLTTILFTTGFQCYNLSVLPFMMIAAIVGALLGGIINKRIHDHATVILFNFMQVVIFGLCVFNIIMLFY